MFRQRHFVKSVVTGNRKDYSPSSFLLPPSSTITYIYQAEENTYTIPFIDEASIENSITCAAVALHLGLTPAQLADRMPRLEPVAMRLEVKQGQHGCILINDSYNSDINSLDIALDFMNRRESSPPELGGVRGGLNKATFSNLE